MEIKDSGNRREFQGGAVRDMWEGKGRFDLIPMGELACATDDEFFGHITRFMTSADSDDLLRAAKYVAKGNGEISDINVYNSLLKLAKHYENGMRKYGKDNWRKGIPLSSYVDSACRHYCKWRSGWEDEDHLSACLFNLLCGAWTCENKPEYNDYIKED